jgi:hypothetical protein
LIWLLEQASPLMANEAEGRNAPACAPIVNRNSLAGHAKDFNRFIANSPIHR